MLRTTPRPWARVGLHELERPLDLASPEDDPCQGVAGPRADEIRDERARAEQRAGLSKEEAARRRHESAECHKSPDETRAAGDDSQARTEQYDAGVLHPDHCLNLSLETVQVSVGGLASRAGLIDIRLDSTIETDHMNRKPGPYHERRRQSPGYEKTT